MDKLAIVNNILSKNDYSTLEHIDSIDKIYDLYANNIMFEPETIGEIMYVGIYYEINKQYDLMIKYFLIACEKAI